MKRPEMKMPDLKVPVLLEDIYWDLRERRLLPLVALVVVAIVAVPFLMRGDAEEPVASPPAGALIAPGGVIDNAASLTVAQANPGLRDYRRRLSDRKPSNPFRQRYSAPVLDGSELNPETGGSSGSTFPVGDTGGESSNGSPSGSPGGSLPSPQGTGKTPELTLFAFAIKVSITKSGGKGASSKKKERTVRERVLPYTALPGKKAPVVTYMGPSGNGKRALLLVSTKVESVFGDIRCMTNEDICLLIEVEPGFPVTFVYGANEVRYTVNVLKIEPVIIGRS